MVWPSGLAGSQWPQGDRGDLAKLMGLPLERVNVVCRAASGSYGQLSSAGVADRVHRYAAELVALAPDVILANGSAPLGPLQQATRTVPIVFAAALDPVSASAMSRAWHGWAETSPDLPHSNSASVGNGLGCTGSLAEGNG
jgi:hypothetical protein